MICFQQEAKAKGADQGTGGPGRMVPETQKPFLPQTFSNPGCDQAAKHADKVVRPVYGPIQEKNAIT